MPAELRSTYLAHVHKIAALPELPAHRADACRADVVAGQIEDSEGLSREEKVGQEPAGGRRKAEVLKVKRLSRAALDDLLYKAMLMVLGRACDPTLRSSTIGSAHRAL